MLLTAILLITAALACYTAGVWAEHRTGVLAPTHSVLFALGLSADASGTYVMSLIQNAGTAVKDGTAGVLQSVMAVTGALALVLMAVHLLWALVVLIRNRAAEKATFHRFSLIVWAIWLVPYFTGMASSMVR